MIDLRTRDAGGGALFGGFLLVVLVLFRSPSQGLEAATRSGQSMLYFLVLPGLGLLAGGYAVRGGPYSAALTFLFGSYLGVFGLALTFGTLLAPGGVRLTLLVGLLLLGLAVVAVVSSVLSLVESLHLGSTLDPTD